jgi:hypothetical protein
MIDTICDSISLDNAAAAASTPLAGATPALFVVPLSVDMPYLL